MNLNNQRVSALLSQANADCEDLQKRFDVLNESFTRFFPYSDPSYLSIPSSFESMQKIWHDLWQRIDHDEPDMQMRQFRARAAIYTPLSINPNSYSGRFRGTDHDYSTSLIRCDCMDFQKHLRPCKHMYRLAHEFGVFVLDGNVEYVPDPDKFFSNRTFSISTIVYP